MRRRFRQVDVFGSRPFTGNPVAVVADGTGLSTEQMQTFARWTNLAETTFVLPPSTPQADYQVRIFTPAVELPFAGHPTLGTCHAWLAEGGVPREPGVAIQECPAGLIPVRTGGERLAFAAPPLIRSGPVDDGLVGELAAVAGIGVDEVVDAQWLDNGPGWAGLLLRDADAVLRVQPDIGRWSGSGMLALGLAGLYPAGSEYAVEIRAVFSDDQGTLHEDPVTGSLNAAVAQWLLAAGRLSAPYVASQGTCLGRSGRVHVSEDADSGVWVGGATTSSIVGEVDL